MSWAMSDSEIRSMWRTCKNRNEQVRILADLNIVTRAEMLDKLRELGCDMRGVRTGKTGGGAPRKPPMDELRAMDLYRQGLDDLAISEAMGETMNQVKEWRRRMKLPTIKKERKEPECAAEAAVEEPGIEEPSGQAPGAMNAAALSGILKRLVDGYAEDEISVEADGTEINRAVVEVVYNCSGGVERVKLHLLSE